MKSLHFLLPLMCATTVLAGEPKPDAEGWITLFNGKDFTGFTSTDGGPVKWTVEDGAMCGDKKLGDIWTTQQFGDFVLELEFKTTGNSGVFFRTSDPRDNVQTGIEIQVENPGGPNRHSVGAIYDLVPPLKNAAKKDEWNKYVITAKGPHITVVLNGEKINEANLDQWTTAGKNPDGSENKFSRALSQFARIGHIGFQDHDHKVWYRNVRVKPLDPAKN